MGATKKTAKVIAAGVGTVWVKPEDGGVEMVAFAEGDKVPAWAAEQMGDHCFTTQDGSDEPDEDPADDEGDVSYDALKKADLEAAVKARNEGREDDDLIVVGGNGTKADLIAALEADDESAEDEDD